MNHATCLLHNCSNTKSHRLVLSFTLFGPRLKQLCPPILENIKRHCWFLSLTALSSSCIGSFCISKTYLLFLAYHPYLLMLFMIMWILFRLLTQFIICQFCPLFQPCMETCPLCSALIPFIQEGDRLNISIYAEISPRSSTGLNWWENKDQNGNFKPSLAVWQDPLMYMTAKHMDRARWGIHSGRSWSDQCILSFLGFCGY